MHRPSSHDRDSTTHAQPAARRDVEAEVAGHQHVEGIAVLTTPRPRFQREEGEQGEHLALGEDRFHDRRGTGQQLAVRRDGPVHPVQLDLPPPRVDARAQQRPAVGRPSELLHREAVGEGVVELGAQLVVRLLEQRVHAKSAASFHGDVGSPGTKRSNIWRCPGARSAARAPAHTSRPPRIRASSEAGLGGQIGPQVVGELDSLRVGNRAVHHPSAQERRHAVGDELRQHRRATLLRCRPSMVQSASFGALYMFQSATTR